MAGVTVGSIPYQSAANVTSFTNAGTSGQVLTSSSGASAPTWGSTVANATTATKATNLAGGAFGSIPYQLLSGSTTFLAYGATNLVFTSNGPGNDPSWRGAPTPSTISATTISSSLTYYPLITVGVNAQNVNNLSTAGTVFSMNPVTGLFTYPSINVGINANSTLTSIGISAGKLGANNTNFGYGAGESTNANSTSNVAIGYYAGRNKQGGTTVGAGNSVAIGVGAGQGVNGSATVFQDAFAVAIGAQAGASTTSGQGLNSVAIGSYAGSINQAPNSIIINATGNTSPAQSTTSGCFINPIRDIPNGLGAGRVYYNDTTKELYFSST